MNYVIEYGDRWQGNWFDGHQCMLENVKNSTNTHALADDYYGLATDWNVRPLLLFLQCASDYRCCLQSAQSNTANRYCLLRPGYLPTITYAGENNFMLGSFCEGLHLLPP